ncbi:hypothetical protein [Fervidibacter sacchari]
MSVESRFFSEPATRNLFMSACFSRLRFLRHRLRVGGQNGMAVFPHHRKIFGA